MMVTDAQTAAQYVNSWRSQSPTQRIWMFTIAIEAQEACRATAETYGDTVAVMNRSEAIGILRKARHEARVERGDYGPNYGQAMQ